MAGIVDALLGGALGASGALVSNAKLQQQTEADEAKENRRLGREAFLMELRSKYNQQDAEHASGLRRGEMDKQGQISRDNAKYQNDLQLNALSDPRTVDAEKRKTASEFDGWKKKHDITSAHDMAKIDRELAGKRSLLAMRQSASGKGDDGGDGAGMLGNPDFIDARKDLMAYFGLGGADGNLAKQKLVAQYVPANRAGKGDDMGEIIEASTYLMAANPNISPEEAMKIGSDVVYKRTPLQTAKLPNGQHVQYVTIGGKRYMYGRAN